MSDIICVTNRKLCQESFLIRIRKIAKQKPKAIILREKDLTAEEYKELAVQVLAICKEEDVTCILHTFAGVAKELSHPALHVPLPVLRTLSVEEKREFVILGASCHSVEEAVEAEALGCTYLTAGHIFDTDCKMGLPGRGLSFLEEVCKKVSIPVYAIGGIDREKMESVRKAGAKGACIMSSAMQGGVIWD